MSAKTRAAHIPGVTRLAVAARDWGCRFPGSSAPLGWADLHHLVPRAHGAPTIPTTSSTSPDAGTVSSTATAGTQHLDPQTGELTITRDGRTWRSLPRGTPSTGPTNR
ncbi:MAG: hypothetical protein M3252_00525 [Actinomycetota bacterium]|nr:hypothetical protein [Actinomycetota bacterium]